MHSFRRNKCVFKRCRVVNFKMYWLEVGTIRLFMHSYLDVHPMLVMINKIHTVLTSLISLIQLRPKSKQDCAGSCGINLLITLYFSLYWPIEKFIVTFSFSALSPSRRCPKYSRQKITKAIMRNCLVADSSSRHQDPHRANDGGQSYSDHHGCK